MKKFRFRLQSFLGYRKHLEQEAKQAVSITRTKIDACKNRIDAYELNQKKNISELYDKMSIGIDAKQIPIYTSYHDRLSLILKNENMQYAHLQKELSHKQKILKQRSVEKKALENLQQRKKEEYYKKISDSLQKESEDMNIIRKIRDINK
jgi:flagellar export protein FliJ